MKTIISIAVIAAFVTCPFDAHVMAWSVAQTQRKNHLRSSSAVPPITASNGRAYYASLLFATSEIPTPYDDLSSAYDMNLPPSMVGEAVRAALRSDRGICFDFSTNQYSDNGPDGRLVSVVKIHGKGTRSFLNAKFSQSVPKQSVGVSTSLQSLELIRSGLAFETGYLTSKGRIIDRILALAFLNESEDGTDEAFLITSPGNNASNLYNELDKFVFPMDQVTLTDCSSSSQHDVTSVITLACAKLSHAQTSFNNNVVELLGGENAQFQFPSRGVCNHYRTKNADVYILEHTFLSTDVCHGYTLVIQGDGSLSNQIWRHMTDEQNDKGPVGVGSLEYETLRIEAGIPGYGYEMSGDGPKKKQSPTDIDSTNVADNNEEAYFSKANPLELHLQYLVDTEKGCYQGQEGVASMMKNARGSPRIL
jgi:folate-binding Fe-S cluster repair protein YgfZ